MNKKDNLFPGYSVISKYEKNLQLEEEKYHSFFEKNPIPQWIYNEETKQILEVNHAAIKKYGYTREEFLKLTILDLRPKEDVVELKKFLNKPFSERKKTIKDKPFRHKTKQSEIIYVDIESSIYKKIKGVNLIFVSVIDVTDRIKYQNELIASEERFKRLNDASVEGIVIHEKGIVLEYNNAFCNIFKLNPKEALGLNLVTLVHPDSKKLLLKNMFGGTEEPYEAKGIRKDGKSIVCELQGKQIKYHNKECRVVSIRDISERKKIEEALKNKEAFFKVIADNASDIIFRYSFYPEYKLDYISPSIEKITGYSSANFYKNPMFGYSLVHPEDVHKTQKSQDFIKSSKRLKKIEVNSYVLRWLTKSGETIWIETVNNPIYDKDNKVIAVEGISRNITERILSEQQNQTLSDSYKELIDSSPFGIIITEINNTKIIYANTEALKIAGYKNLNQVLGKKIIDNIAKKYHQRINERVAKSLQGKDVTFLEVEYLRPDGKAKFVETKPIKIVFKGKPAMQIVMRDITNQKEIEKEQLRTQLAEQSNKILQKEIFERIKAEKELKKAQLYLQSIIESSLDMICAADSDGKIIEFNSAAQKTFGYTTEEIKGKKFDFLFAKKSDKKDVIEPIEKKRTIFQGEILNKRKNGEEFLSYLSASPLISEKGEVIGSMGVSRDITEIKRKEEELRLQTAKLNAIFESGSHFIWTINRKGEVTSINKNLKIFLKDSLGFNTNTNTFQILDFYKALKHKKTVDFWKANFVKALKGEPLQFEIKYYNKKGKKFWREVFLYPIYDNKDKVLEISCMAFDITEKKIAESLIQEKTAKLNAIFESSTHYIWTVNKALQLTSYNKNYFSFAHKNYGIRLEIGATSLKTISRNDAKREKFWKEKYRLAFKGIPQFFETSFEDKGGKTIWREVFLHPINTNSSEIMEVSAISHDITEKKKIEEETIIQSAKLNAVINSSSHMIYTLNKNHELTSFNENYYTTCQYNFGTKLTVGASLDKLRLQTMDKAEYTEWRRLHDLALKGIKSKYVAHVINKRKEHIWYETYLDPIILKNGKVEEVAYIAHDITEQIQASAAIKSSLKEKEVLLQEVHHRVKNNLQVISSILNLQSSYVKDPKTLNLLLESQNRIKSMSFIHEILYQTKDFSNINFKDYILSIVNNLSHSYRTNSNVLFEFDIDNISLHLDTSIPCGLIINELISNALKYAFPDNKRGKITVRIKKKNGKIDLEVSDNGIGFPKTVDFKNTNSLGLQLVNSLTDQVNGKITLNATNGTKFLITFNQ